MVGPYDLDDIAIEENEDGEFDFRFELGDGYRTMWALPTSGGGHLRLFHMGGMAYDIDEPELEDSFFFYDFGPMTFEGPVGPIRSVTIEMTKTPPTYLCVLLLEGRAPVELRWPAT